MTDLAPLLVLTNRAQCAPGVGLLELVQAAVDAGARAVVLREKDRPGAERAQLARHLLGMLEPVGGLLIAASGPGLPAHGVHLAAGDPFPPPRAAPPGGPDRQVLGRSCHSAADVAAAAAEGCDYVTVSPVFPTTSKPGYGPALDLDGLAELAASSPVPVYALGGVTPGKAAACLEAGAAGVAVMGAIGSTPAEATAAVGGLLAALGEPSDASRPGTSEVRA